MKFNGTLGEAHILHSSLDGGIFWCWCKHTLSGLYLPAGPLGETIGRLDSRLETIFVVIQLVWKIKGNFPCLHQFHLITLLGIATNSSPQILIRFRVSQSNVKVGEAVCGVAQPKQVFIPWWLNECHVAVSVSFILLSPPHCCVVPRRSNSKKTRHVLTWKPKPRRGLVV